MGAQARGILRAEVRGWGRTGHAPYRRWRGMSRARRWRSRMVRSRAIS